MTSPIIPPDAEALGASHRKVSSGVDENYINALMYQWLVEIWRNASHAANRKNSAKWKNRVGADRPVLVYDFANIHPGVDAAGNPTPFGALKRTIWNTGPHMEPDELERYFSTLGEGEGGGNGDWSLDNPTGDRHAGVRETLLPWNTAGLVVLTYHPVHLPQGAMMWFYYDEVLKLYLVKKLDTGNTDIAGNPILAKVVDIGPDHLGFDWWTVVDQLESAKGDNTFRRLGGVALVLLGTDLTEDDPEGVDTGKRYAPRQENVGGSMRALLNKVAVPGLRVAFRYPVSRGSKTGAIKDWWTLSDGTPLSGDSRTIHGERGWLESGQLKNVKGGGQLRAVLPHTKGIWKSAKYPGLEIEWTMLDTVRAMSAGQASSVPYNGKGHVILRYREEFMSTPPNADLPDVFSTWGIPYAEVYDRLRLIIRAPQDAAAGFGWFVKQDPTRSRMTDADGAEPEYDGWKDEWCESIPTPIQDEIDKYAAANQDKYTQQLALRILKQSRERKGAFQRQQEQEEVERALKNTDDGTAAAGEQPAAGGRGGKGGKGGGGGGNGDGDGAGTGGNSNNVVDPSKPGTHRTRVGKTEDGLPQPQWRTEAEWKADKLDPDIFVYMPRSGSGHILRFNMGHPFYKDMHSFWTVEFRKTTRSARLKRKSLKSITEAVKAILWADSASRIVNVLQYDSSKSALSRFELPSDHTLTWGAEHVESLDHAIRALLHS